MSMYLTLSILSNVLFCFLKLIRKRIVLDELKKQTSELLKKENRKVKFSHKKLT